MADLDAILAGDLSDPQAFQAAATGVTAARHEAESRLEEMVRSWAPESRDVSAACAAQKRCAAACARSEQLVQALAAVDAAVAELEAQQAALDSPLAHIAALSAVPVLNATTQDASHNEVPVFASSVVRVLAALWADAAAPLRVRAERVERGVAVCVCVMRATGASDAAACQQVLLLEANVHRLLAAAVSRWLLDAQSQAAATAGSSSADAAEAAAVLAATVARLADAAREAQERELALRLADCRALLRAVGSGGLAGTVHSEKRTAVHTAFTRLADVLREVVENWCRGAPGDGRRLAMRLCAGVADAVVALLLDVELILESECGHLRAALGCVVRVREQCLGAVRDDDDEAAAAALERAWARLLYMHTVLDYTMAQIAEHWPLMSRVIAPQEMARFVQAAYTDNPKRRQLLATLAATPLSQ